MAEKTRFVAVKLRKYKRICPITGYKEESIKISAPVIVETERGVENGEIVEYAHGWPKTYTRDVKLKKVVRYATAEDVKQTARLKEFEDKAIQTAEQKVREHELKIHVLSIEYLFDMAHVFIYYKVDEGQKNVNLRNLGKDLSTTLKARVELKQISPRDQARWIGGLGQCGRELCCATWLDKPKHVTVKMVKNQGLAMSMSKTSGACGRLMCCLEYEFEKEKGKGAEEK
ncbi:MAG: regulatory iron-sulfur-containing complex subunit RicT [Candidatus Margulisbacteria bacterium]|nr:regulatory iron-sulfur-containing complex subunit RicT [Candidatus Margulisiibacteriota bacterium]